MYKQGQLSLVETNDCKITFSKSAKRFLVTYKSCQASFNIKEFEHFHLLLGTLRAHQFQYEYLGEPRAIVKSPHACAGFCLSEEDVRSLSAAVAESLTLFDAYNVIYRF